VDDTDQITPNIQPKGQRHIQIYTLNLPIITRVSENNETLCTRHIVDGFPAGYTAQFLYTTKNISEETTLDILKKNKESFADDLDQMEPSPCAKQKTYNAKRDYPH
jgi:hypothetical protein